MTELLSHGLPDREALVDASGAISYAELRARVASAASILSGYAGDGRNGIVFLGAANTFSSVILYLACLDAGIPVCLLDLSNPQLTERLFAVYRPRFVALSAPADPPAGYRVAGPILDHLWLTAESAAAAAPHPELALLLTTSGSTGDPKLVRLSRRNLLANAGSIAEFLGIQAEDRAIQSLPLHYSFGLSVLHSHLLRGATVILTGHSFLQREFWHTVEAHRVTAFAGVPYMYETLHRLRFDPARYPSLKTMTQAGGALRPELIDAFRRKAESAGVRFFVMYGQTEATARISYVPPERLAGKAGSIGMAIPGGMLSLEPVPGDAGVQELVYRGPNVMLGYATSAEDLALGDELGGVLRTGDLARVDEDGFYFITGRLRRFAKLYGRRVNLEDVERELESHFPVRVIALDTGDHLTVYAEGNGSAHDSELRSHLARLLEVPPKAVTVIPTPALPMTASGKKDYRASMELHQAARTGATG